MNTEITRNRVNREIKREDLQLKAFQERIVLSVHMIHYFSDIFPYKKNMMTCYSWLIYTRLLMPLFCCCHCFVVAVLLCCYCDAVVLFCCVVVTAVTTVTD